MLNKGTLYFLMVVCLTILISNYLYASVDTRLIYVSNSFDTPVSGKGTLIINVEAHSNNGTATSIAGFQDAFQIDASLLAQNPVATFSNQRFPAPNYTITEDINNSSGRIRYVYSYAGGSQITIETNWTLIVTVAIEYQMTNETGSISWYTAGEPNFRVLDGFSNDITGSEEEIPVELMDFSLPVELSTLSAHAESRKVMVNWTTESEINNAGFEIWRSTEETGTYQLYSSYANNPSLLGQGNSTMRHEYQFQDGLVVAGQTYWYKLADVDVNGEKTFHGPVSASLSLNNSALNSISADIPSHFKLYSNYPNPFNPETTLRFDIPVLRNGEASAQLMVYNILGQVVKDLFSGRLGPGSFEIRWDGTTDAGNNLPGGIYYAVLTLGSYREIVKMTLVK